LEFDHTGDPVFSPGREFRFCLYYGFTPLKPQSILPSSPRESFFCRAIVSPFPRHTIDAAGESSLCFVEWTSFPLFSRHKPEFALFCLFSLQRGISLSISFPSSPHPHEVVRNFRTQSQSIERGRCRASVVLRWVHISNFCGPRPTHCRDPQPVSVLFFLHVAYIYGPPAVVFPQTNLRTPNFDEGTALMVSNDVSLL